MNTMQLVQAIASETGKTNAQASRFLDTFLDVVRQQLKSGGEVAVSGFGKFVISQRAPRTGVTPRTAKKIQIPASRSSSFTPGSTLKDSIKDAP